MKGFEDSQVSKLINKEGGGSRLRFVLESDREVTKDSQNKQKIN